MMTFENPKSRCLVVGKSVLLRRAAQRGISPTVTEGSKTYSIEPSLTVGLLTYKSRQSLRDTSHQPRDA